MGDTIQSFLELGASSIPYQRAACCCGNEACVYLKQNATAVTALERDVRTAAQLGQALLQRHETYIADSERERKAMTAHIEQLESEKVSLERKNATVIAENRDLLDQLEAINSAVTESDAHVTALQATLQSTQLELQKLASLAARTERLEQQLLEYEQEQATWETSLETKEQSERSAVRRWQHAERSLAGMQEQIERIEREAREERERHIEVVGRMERRHAVEMELTTAAGRLKGAAAGKTMGDPGGTSIVSHFVKDILQDNANLQMGIVELREMLQTSNDEVEVLRRQMEDHRPAAASPEIAPTKKTDLRQELQRASSSELHVHHHYHAPTPGTTKTPTIRRAKKKRYGVLTPGHFTPPSGFSTPRSSVSYGTPSSAATILQQTAVSIPQGVSSGKRFSAQSNMTYHSMLSSSGPASPQSTTNRTSSIFDRVFSDGGHESSRPTTPGSDDLGSPLMAPIDSKRLPMGPFRTASAPVVHRRGISPGAGRASVDSVLGTSLDSQLLARDAIPEETEGEWENESSRTGETPSDTISPLSDDLLDPIHHNDNFYRPPLRRAASHESMISVSGMDIHTIKSRPSQLLGGHSSRPLATRAALSGAHTQATGTTATLSRPSDSSRNVLSGMATEQRRLASKSSSQGFGSKVGGWVFGRWGATPAPMTSTAPVAASAALKSSVTPKPLSRTSTASGDPASFDPEATPKKLKIRPPGINQSGPIMGFGPELKIAHPPVMRGLDAEALQMALSR
ncbi:hypothetical protein LTR56_014414 [Elasticomyces elasticus]|nr:hypothetical protein LTR22_020567 [Elasticomyces elasticus]KAK3636038.1 hypothetical protein LTR56_014414 [Elasticomyces elasticus]KAK4916681.1 hypothetical protein LTR49_015379 [Elasticomyces elasticus]KAK5754955.1 hypothetical protein LTS12_014988 [Elasticomyces elasticus]